MTDARTPSTSRRTVIRAAVAGGAAAATGGAAVSTAAAQSSGGLSAWFSNTSNYDGVVDETGSSSVTVKVGTEANGGAFGYGPAAVRVDPGTTVTWEWTGNGGSHNVVADSGAFESELVGDAGHTFEHTFEESGVFKYACTPHKAMGMKGAVVVGDASVGGGSGGGGGSESTATATESATTTANESSGAAAGGGSGGGDGGAGGAGDAPAWMLLGGGIGAALSPLIFGLFLLVVGDGSDGSGGRSGNSRSGGSDDPTYRADGGRPVSAAERPERR